MRFSPFTGYLSKSLPCLFCKATPSFHTHPTTLPSRRRQQDNGQSPAKLAEGKGGLEQPGLWAKAETQTSSGKPSSRSRRKKILRQYYIFTDLYGFWSQDPRLAEHRGGIIFFLLKEWKDPTLILSFITTQKTSQLLRGWRYGLSQHHKSKWMYLLGWLCCTCVCCLLAHTVIILIYGLLFQLFPPPHKTGACPQVLLTPVKISIMKCHGQIPSLRKDIRAVLSLGRVRRVLQNFAPTGSTAGGASLTAVGGTGQQEPWQSRLTKISGTGEGDFLSCLTGLAIIKCNNFKQFANPTSSLILL